MVHLLLTTKTCTAEQLAKCYEREIVRLHGLPDNIVSDRDVWFVSRFWQTLHESLGIELFMSTKTHPQTDGQTENANGVLEDTLRHFVSPFQKHMHPVCHVSALRPYHRNGPYQPPLFPALWPARGQLHHDAFAQLARSANADASQLHCAARVLAAPRARRLCAAAFDVLK